MRYEVHTVTGYRQPGVSGQRRSPGVSVYVVDTLRNHQVIASFQSEDRAAGRARGGVLGAERALELATALAERLNDDHTA